LPNDSLPAETKGRPHQSHFALEVSPLSMAAFVRLGGTVEWLPIAHHAFFLHLARIQIPAQEQLRGFAAAAGYRLYSEDDGPHGWFGDLIVEESDVSFKGNPNTPNEHIEHAHAVSASIEGGYKWSFGGWLLGVG
jgi:hypothetical protein